MESRRLGRVGAANRVLAMLVLASLIATFASATTDQLLAFADVHTGPVQIAEFLAVNDSTEFVDEEGDSSDWIELLNTSGAAVDLGGWLLRDSGNSWLIPSLVLDPGERMVIWASGKDRGSPGAGLHTNFKLKSSGEYLALIDPAGVTSSAYDPYPAQSSNISYGIDSLGSPSYFEEPTPARANSVGSAGQAAIAVAGIGRGFYTSALTETLTSATVGATIRYTLDGSEPSETSAAYTGPITIVPSDTGIVSIRAIVYADGYAPSDEVSYSYIFHSHMYPDDARAGAGIRTAPVVVLHLDEGTVDRKTRSMIEMIDPAGPGFSLRGGSKIVGNAGATYPKKLRRLYFDEKYGGPDNLVYPVFAGADRKPGWYEPVEVFDKLNLHTFSDEYYKTPVYLSERFWKSSMRDLGGLVEYGRYITGFVDGDFRGVYQLTEFTDDFYLRSYGEGGPKEEYDAVPINYWYQVGAPYSGTGLGWKDVFADRRDYNLVKDRLHAEDLVRLTVMSSVNGGAHLQGQYRAFGSIVESSRDDFRYLARDLDRELWHMANRADNPRYQRYPHFFPFGESYGYIKYWVDEPEVRQMMDRIGALALCPGGVLTVEGILETIAYWEAEMERLIPAEAARWGSRHETEWRANMETIKTEIAKLGTRPYDEWVRTGWITGCGAHPDLAVVEHMVTVTGQPVSYLVEAEDPDSATLAFSAQGLPPGLSIDSNSGEIAGTPTVAGTYDVVVRVDSPDAKWTSATIEWNVLAAEPASPGPLVVNEYNAVTSSERLGDGAGSDTRFGAVDGNGGDWFELLVTEDEVDLRGYRVELWDRDRDFDELARTETFVFSTDAALAQVSAGTLITVAETGVEDLSIDPGRGDWVISAVVNANRTSALFTRESQESFDTNRHEQRFIVTDPDGSVVSVVTGETDQWRSTGSNVTARSVMALCVDPTANFDPLAAYQAEELTSTFGEPNVCEGERQDLAGLRGFVLGDVNCDAARGLVDAAVLAQYLAGRRSAGDCTDPGPTEINLGAADVDASGEVGLTDIIVVLECVIAGSTRSC